MEAGLQALPRGAEDEKYGTSKSQDGLMTRFEQTPASGTGAPLHTHPEAVFMQVGTLNGHHVHPACAVHEAVEFLDRQGSRDQAAKTDSVQDAAEAWNLEGTREVQAGKLFARIGGWALASNRNVPAACAARIFSKRLSP